MAHLLEVSLSQVNDPVWQMEMHHHLRMIGGIGDLESCLARYRLLSDAWFADALHFERPFLLALDAYEGVSNLFDRWFSQDFLVGVAHSRRMRVVVSGQRLPQEQTGWHFCASLQELMGVHETRVWLAWAGQAGYRVPSLDVLSGVVLALKGNPSQIVEVVKSFPPVSGTVSAKEAVVATNGRISTDKPMDDNLLQQLIQASSDQERAALVLEISLSGLAPALQTAVKAAAIPHWFDARLLEALLGEESDNLYGSLLQLSFVEQLPERGYVIRERIRQQLLQKLWQEDREQFRRWSKQAANYCERQAHHMDSPAWQAETIYHRLVGDPKAGVTALRSLAANWVNNEHYTHEEIERIVRLATEQMEAGRLKSMGAAWTRLWQTKVSSELRSFQPFPLLP